MEIVNANAFADRYFVVKLCRKPCPDRCGACLACRFACPEDCDAGLAEGNGHVWAVCDRLPVRLVAEVEAARADLLRLGQRGAASEEDARAALDRVRDIVLTLFRRTYPALRPETLDAEFDYAAYLTVLQAFLSRQVPSGTTPPASSTPSATPERKKRSRSS